MVILHQLRQEIYILQVALIIAEQHIGRLTQQDFTLTISGIRTTTYHGLLHQETVGLYLEQLDLLFYGIGDRLLTLRQYSSDSIRLMVT